MVSEVWATVTARQRETLPTEHTRCKQIWQYENGLRRVKTVLRKRLAHLSGEAALHGTDRAYRYRSFYHLRLGRDNAVRRKNGLANERCHTEQEKKNQETKQASCDDTYKMKATRSRIVRRTATLSQLGGIQHAVVSWEATCKVLRSPSVYCGHAGLAWCSSADSKLNRSLSCRLATAASTRVKDCMPSV